MSEKHHNEDVTSPAANAKKHGCPNPEPPSSKRQRVEAEAQPAVEDYEDADEYDDDDDDDEDDESWSGEEDFDSDEMSEEEIQANARRLCHEIRVALCNGLVWKPSCIRGNASINVEVKADHYQVAISAFGRCRDPEDEMWTAIHISTKTFNENFGPIYNLIGTTPLTLTGNQVRIHLYDDGEFTANERWQQTITVIVSATYGTPEARDRLQDTDVCPSDLEGMFSSDDGYSIDSDDEEGYYRVTEDTMRLDPCVH